MISVFFCAGGLHTHTQTNTHMRTYLVFGVPLLRFDSVSYVNELCVPAHSTPTDLFIRFFDVNGHVSQLRNQIAVFAPLRPIQSQTILFHPRSNWNMSRKFKKNHEITYSHRSCSSDYGLWDKNHDIVPPNNVSTWWKKGSPPQMKMDKNWEGTCLQCAACPPLNDAQKQTEHHEKNILNKTQIQFFDKKYTQLRF